MNLLNPLDIGIVVIVGYCLIRGFFRGFVKEAFSLIGILGGFHSACNYYSELTKFLSRWISHTPYLNILSFLLIFVGVFVLISLLGVAIKYLLNIVFLGWIDRLLGVVTGSVKGFLIVSILLLGFSVLLPEWKPLMKRSYLSPKITMAAKKLTQLVPRSVKREVNHRIDEFERTWKANVNK
jgi:membrane protein required for colicin V production